MKILAPALLFLIFWTGSFASAQTHTSAAAPANASMDSVEAILTRITDLLSLGQHNEVIALFGTIPAPHRDSPHLRLLQASVLSNVERYDEARSAVDAVIRAEPGNIEALLMLAAIERAQGRNQQEQAALERIIRIDPDNIGARIALGNLNLRSRSFRPAAANFHRVLTTDPNNVTALLGMGRTFRMNREWDEAELYLNRAVELFPNNSEARTERASFYRSRERRFEALSDLDEAKRINPGDYWIAIDRGNTLLEMNMRAEALEEFSRAVSINPGEFLAYVYTSGLKDELGDLDDAARDYAVLVRIRPSYYYAYEGLGLHRMRTGRWSEARDAFMEAYRQAPHEHLYALLAAISWIRAEDITSPRAFLGQALSNVRRDTLEWHMFRLYHDLTARNFSGEHNMTARLNQEQDQEQKARMTFYMAMYHDIRGNTTLANRYFLLVNELNIRAIPEWRLNEWILAERNLKVF